MILTVCTRDNEPRRQPQSIQLDEKRYAETLDDPSYFHKVNNRGIVRIDSDGRYEDNEFVRLFASLS